MEIEDLKKSYAGYEKKYALPSFKKINEDFEIEKIAINSEILPRIIRKIMMDKVINFHSFLERLLSNPAGLSRVYYSFIKSMNEKDKNEAEKIYNTLGELNLSAFKLEISSSEKEEAEFIKKIYSVWQSVKPGFLEIALKMKEPEDMQVKKEKSYFG